MCDFLTLVILLQFGLLAPHALAIFTQLPLLLLLLAVFVPQRAAILLQALLLLLKFAFVFLNLPAFLGEPPFGLLFFTTILLMQPCELTLLLLHLCQEIGAGGGKERVCKRLTRRRAVLAVLLQQAADEGRDINIILVRSDLDVAIA